MNLLKFSTNWNNKLNCTCFSTIRKKSDKYKVGESFKIMVRNDAFGEILQDGLMYCDFGNATILTVSEFCLVDLNNSTSYLDSGYSAAELKDFFQSELQYSKYENLVFVVLQYNGIEVPLKERAIDQTFTLKK